MIEFPFADIYNYMSYRYKGLSDGWGTVPSTFWAHRPTIAVQAARPAGKTLHVWEAAAIPGPARGGEFQVLPMRRIPASIRFGADGEWRGATQALASSAFLWLHPHPQEGSGSFGFSEAAAGAG